MAYLIVYQRIKLLKAWQFQESAVSLLRQYITMMTTKQTIRLWLLAATVNTAAGCAAMSLAAWVQKLGVAEVQMPLARLNALKLGFGITAVAGAVVLGIGRIVTNLKTQSHE